MRIALPVVQCNILLVLYFYIHLMFQIAPKILIYVFVKDLELQWVETFSKIKLILILMQEEEETSVYPQLVELQQQLQQQLGKRVELSRCHLYCAFLCYFGDILVLSIGENVWSLSLYWFKAHQICLPACLILVQSRLPNVLSSRDLLLVQSTSPNTLSSLLAGAEALYQRQGAAAAQARKLLRF